MGEEEGQLVNSGFAQDVGAALYRASCHEQQEGRIEDEAAVRRSRSVRHEHPPRDDGEDGQPSDEADVFSEEEEREDRGEDGIGLEDGDGAGYLA